MNFWEAILLGVVQGLTEFLPVSSSGHLILFEHLLGFQNLKQYILFDLICHLGTLTAVFIVFSDTVKQAITNKKQLQQLGLALIPLVFLFPFLKMIQTTFDQIESLGFFFCTTALILFAGERLRFKSLGSPHFDALFVGFSQACAIFPGVSRSGTTISAGRLLGWNATEAVRFSFLLSIPTILGGVLLEVFKLFKTAHIATEISAITYFTGFFSSFFVGVFALKLLLRIIGSAKFQIFAWYCLALGLATLYFYY